MVAAFPVGRFTAHKFHLLVSTYGKKDKPVFEGFLSGSEAAIPVYLVKKGGLSPDAGVPEAECAYGAAVDFKGQAGRILYCQDEQGAVRSVLYGLGTGEDAFVVAGLSAGLVGGTYRLENLAAKDADTAVLAWAIGTYSFDRYLTGAEKETAGPRLVLPESVNGERASVIARGAMLARDLVNTPASDMGPEELEAEARKLADEFGAEMDVTVGDDLLERNLFMIHAVGRASVRAPRLIDLTWGDESHPKVTLVGKGVCFDTGGLNLKPGGSMTLMKKDMGGAANILGLALMIMGAGLKVRLRVLVPAVENSVAGEAYRPGDVLQSRKGLTVEIGNTDAEGRLVLGDALTLGDEEEPDLMIDMATLTGAARVALGPELPAFYTDDEALADALEAASKRVHDPFWRMPLWKPYLANLKSSTADINHITTDGFAGSITAALFLQKFVSKKTSWAHFDIFSWNPKAKPGRKVGAADHAIRSVFELLSDTYG